MSARVVFDTSSAMGQLASEAVDEILRARAKLERVVAAANAMIYNPEGGAADLAQLTTEFGAAEDAGQQLFDRLNGAVEALQDARIDGLREIDQG
jgi:hypothetical protein